MSEVGEPRHSCLRLVGVCTNSQQNHILLRAENLQSANVKSRPGLVQSFTAKEGFSRRPRVAHSSGCGCSGHTHANSSTSTAERQNASKETYSSGKDEDTVEEDKKPSSLGVNDERVSLNAESEPKNQKNQKLLEGIC